MSRKQKEVDEDALDWAINFCNAEKRGLSLSKEELAQFEAWLAADPQREKALAEAKQRWAAVDPLIHRMRDAIVHARDPLTPAIEEEDPVTRQRFVRPDAVTGLPNITRWNALCDRRERMIRRRGLRVWLHFRYTCLPHYVHRRIWRASWGTLIIAVLMLVSKLLDS